MSLNIHKLYTLDQRIFNPDKPYSLGDRCIYLGKSYVCISKNPASTVPTISSDWDRETSKPSESVEPGGGR
jgi:hypothetical protein